MSTTIDQRVVEMRFDKKQFESNVSTTMSTLDKLKQKLHLDGATKGLENIEATSKKVNMSGLSGAVETVTARFSALEVMGVTALANLTNSAVNAGKRIVSALTIDPIKTGMSEYELKMGSIQTIMASTGESLATVNKYLQELNEYSDQTIYSFSDMTQNIGKFTNAGVKLEDAVLAIKGVSNEAAVSGANANEASRAMYNFAQALSAGYVKLIDWKSIENANMATVEFKNQLIEAAVAAGTLEKSSDGMYKVLTKNNMGSTMDMAIDATHNFNDSLNYQWMTTEVLVNTLKDYADETTEIGKKAKAAATEVKTVSQLYDTLKESAQSGWAQTWEIIIGDFEQAKKTLSQVQKYFDGIIGRWSDLRNSLLGGALNLKNPWETITEKFKNSGLGKIVEVADKVEDATDKLKKFQDIVNDVWRGDYKNSDTGRYELLEKAGYDHRVVQELVNRSKAKYLLNDSEYELTINDVEYAHKKFGLTMNETEKQTAKAITSFENLSDEELKNAGLTEGEIRLYRSLASEAKRTGVSISDLVDEMSKNDGRTMLIDSVKNAWDGLSTVLRAVADAWENIFPPITVVQLYSGIKAVKEFSENLKGSEEVAEKVRKTFEGIFAVVDILATILGGGLKIAFKAVTGLLEYFGTDILSVTAWLGQALVKFRDFIDASLDFTKIYEKIIPPITNAIKSFREWISVLKKSENLPQDIAKGIIRGLGKAADFVKAIMAQLVNEIKKGFMRVPDDMNSGLINGIWDGIKVAGQVIVELGKMLIEKIQDVLGIHSPSRVFFAIGGFIIAGLVGGLIAGESNVVDTVKNIGQKCIDALKGIDFGNIFAGALVIGGLVAVTKLADAIGKLAAPFAGFGDMLEEFGDAAKSVGRGVKNFLNAQALLSIAVAIGILAASVAMLADIPAGKLWGAIGALTALVGVIVLLGLVMSKLNAVGDSVKDSKGFGINPKAILSLIAISGALLILSLAIAKLANIDASKLVTTIVLFGSILLGIVVLMKATKGLSSAEFGGTLLAMAAALLLMTMVIAIVGNMKGQTIAKGMIVIGLFGAFVLALTAIASRAGQRVNTTMVKMGGTLLAMATALLILTSVIAILGVMKMSTILKGMTVIALFGAFIIALVGITSLIGGKEKSAMVKMGGTLLGFALGLLVLTGVIKIINGMTVDEIKKGLIVIAVLGTLFVALIAVTKLAGKNAAKAGVTLLAMSAAMLILAGVLFIISMLDPSGVMRALFVVAVIEALMIGLVAATRGVRKCTGAIIALGVIMILLAAAVVALTFIDPSGLGKATAAISAIMISFGVLLSSLGKIKNAKSLWGALVPMIVIVGALTGVVAILSTLQPDNAISNAIGLSILMIALSASLVILDKVKSISASAIAGLGAMSVAAALGGLILAMMSGLNTGNAIENAIGLGILINAMATALLIADKVKSVSVSAMVGMVAMSVAAALGGLILAMMSALNTSNAIENAIGLGIFMNAMAFALSMISAIHASGQLVGAIGCLALVVVAAGIAGLVLAMMTALNVQNAIPNAIALSVFVIAMSFALNMLIPVGAALPMALLGIVGLIVLVAAIGALIAGIGYLVTKFPQLEEFIDKGIPILEKLGIGLGSFLGGIIEGGLNAISNHLPVLADNLSSFGTKLKPFLDAIKDIDGETVGAVGQLAGVVVALTAADFVDGLLSFGKKNQGSALVQFADSMNEAIPNIKKFAENSKDINPDPVENVAKLLGYMSDAAAAIPRDKGMWGWITGNNNDLKQFGTAMASFGQSLTGENGFIASIKDITKDDVDRSGQIKDIIDNMSAAAEAIPRDKGMWGWITGNNNDLGQFGTAMASFGQSLTGENGFLKSIASITNDDLTRSGQVKYIIDKMSEAAEAIPRDKGMWGWITGNNNDLGQFGTAMGTFGTSIETYMTAIRGLGDTDPVKAGYAADILSEMATAAKMIPWFGDISVVNAFGEITDSLSTSLTTFSTNVTDLSIDPIENAVVATDKILGLASRAKDCSGMESFSANLNDLSAALRSYSEINQSAISGVTDKVESMGSKIVDSLINAIKKDDYHKMKTHGENLIKKFKKGIENLKTDVIDAVESMVSGIVSAIKTKENYESFEGAGSYLVSGFINGIDSKIEAAAQKAAAMAAAALEAAKAELREHSPSKAFYEIGAYAGEGFTNALDDYSAMSYEAGAGIAASAEQGLANTLSTLWKWTADQGRSWGLEDIEPTITPVVDLSNVQSGAEDIQSLLSGSLDGSLSSVGDISSIIDSNGQNGSIDEMVKLLGELVDKQGTTGNTTITIGGITYDDDSKVVGYIKSLVNAIEIEGRV